MGVEPETEGLLVGVNWIGLLEVDGLLVVVTRVVVTFFPLYNTSSKS
jgi:hypothetical protein